MLNNHMAMILTPATCLIPKCSQLFNTKTEDEDFDEFVGEDLILSRVWTQYFACSAPNGAENTVIMM